MKKGEWLGVLFFALTILLAGAAMAADEWGDIVIPPNTPIKITVGAALSGGNANFGIDIKNGCEMAILEKGEILGHKITLEPGDDQCEGAPSVALQEKWSNDSTVVGVLGYMCSSGSIAASDVANKYKQIMISPSTTGADYTSRGIPVVFRTCPNDKVQGRVAAEFVLKNKWMRAALIHDKSTWGQGLVDVFRDTYTKGGGKVLAYEAITRGDKDFTPVLTKIKALNPLVVNIGTMVAEGSLMVRQMNQIGLKAKIVGFDGIYAQKDFVEADGKAAVGVYCTYAKEPAGPVFKDWQKNFSAKYGAPIAYAPYGYDAAKVLMAAVEKAAQKKGDGSLVIGKKALRDAVSATKYEGITGPISFDQHGDRSQIAISMNVVACENGKCAYKEIQ
jgi:branched-chain amino acid transport system substrate-binding protein